MEQPAHKNREQARRRQKKSRHTPGGRPTKRRVVVFGLDGATWRIIDRMLNAGRLPNLKRLIEKGARATLLSVNPMVSPVVWTSISSGKSPAKHRVQNFAVRYESVRVKRLWDILDERGLVCGLYGHLLTWPPKPIRGFMIPGFLSATDQTHPAEYAFIKRVAMDEKVGPGGIKRYLRYIGPLLRGGVRISSLARATGFFVGKTIRNYDLFDSFWRKRFVALRFHYDVFRALDRRFRPDYSFFYTNVLDSCSHYYWKFMEPEGFTDVTDRQIARLGDIIYKAYEAVDRVVGEFARREGDGANFIVLSDHGFQTGTWFVRMVQMKGSRILSLLGHEGDFEATNVSFRVHFRPKPHAKDAVGGIVNRLRSATVKGTNEPLFQVEPDEFGSFQVTVNQHTYSALGADNLGEREVIMGRQVFKVKDVLVEEGVPLSGQHHREAMLILSGPDILSGTQLKEKSVMDITPTVLALLGQPVAEDMDGKAIEECFTEEFLQSHPIRTVPTYETEERVEEEIEVEMTEEVRARLRELGYID